jgi:hypothetical protein
MSTIDTTRGFSYLQGFDQGVCRRSAFCLVEVRSSRHDREGETLASPPACLEMLVQSRDRRGHPTSAK